MSVYGMRAFPVSVRGNLIIELIELYHDASTIRKYSIELFESLTKCALSMSNWAQRHSFVIPRCLKEITVGTPVWQASTPPQPVVPVRQVNRASGDSYYAPYLSLTSLSWTLRVAQRFIHVTVATSKLPTCAPVVQDFLPK
jgi:hypothetical protein